MYLLSNQHDFRKIKEVSVMQQSKIFLPKTFSFLFFSLNFDSRYIHNTISDDRIEMSINPGMRGVPANFNPSHATITVETCDPDTKEKEYRRSVELSNYNYHLVKRFNALYLFSMFALIKFELVFIVFKKNIFGWYWAHVQKFRLPSISLQIVPVVSSVC